MTRQEFFGARTRLVRNLEYQSAVSLGVAILASMFPLFVLRELPPVVRLIVAVLAPLAIGFGAPQLFRLRALAKARQLGIVCPKCGENLLLSAVVNDRCSNCRVVVVFKVSIEGAAGLPSKLMFHDRLIAFERANPIYFAFGIPLGTMAGLILLDLLRRQLGIPEPAFARAAMIVLFLSLFVAPLFYKWRLDVLAERLGLCCPECHQSIVGNEFDETPTWYTIRTRKCLHCDSQVVA